MKVKKEEYAPAQNDRVVAENGEGRVVALNEQRRMATILMDDGKTVVASWDDIAKADGGQSAGGCACPHRQQAHMDAVREQREPRERRSNAKPRRDRSDRRDARGASESSRRVQSGRRQPRRTPQHSDEVYE